MEQHTLEDVVEIWLAGKLAPYDLYDVGGILVENTNTSNNPLIVRGSPIPLEIANRVRTQLLVPPHPSVQVPVLVLDANGQPVLDAEGNAMTKLKEVVPVSTINMLSYVAPPLPYDLDQHCDMCGMEFSELFKIGEGWYCKTPRTVQGLSEPESCFNVRLKQMMS